MGWLRKRLHLWRSRSRLLAFFALVRWRQAFNRAAPLYQLLNRVFNIMREKNPDMVAGEKRKFVMKPPQVVRVGTKKTSFVNFTDICKLWAHHLDRRPLVVRPCLYSCLFQMSRCRLHRQPKHLLAFLLAELGTRYACILAHYISANEYGHDCVEVFILYFLFISGSIDGNNQLVIKGRFQQKQIENVLRRYISK